MAERIDATFFTPLKSVSAFKCIDGGIELTVDDMTMQVRVLQPDVVRLRISPGAFAEQPTYAVSADLSNQTANFEVAHDAKSIRLKTSASTGTLPPFCARLKAFW